MKVLLLILTGWMQAAALLIVLLWRRPSCTGCCRSSHPGPPPVDLRAGKVTLPEGWAPPAGHPGFVWPDGSGPHPQPPPAESPKTGP